jgi:hypothetical protein
MTAAACPSRRNAFPSGEFLAVHQSNVGVSQNFTPARGRRTLVPRTGPLIMDPSPGTDRFERISLPVGRRVRGVCQTATS